MALTQSFAEVVNTFVDSDNKPQRISLTLLLGSLSQQLSDDFNANCRNLGEKRERAESHMSLVMAVRTLWLATPELLFTSADPNFERLAKTALSTLGQEPSDTRLVSSLSMIYRRVLNAQRYGRSYITGLDLESHHHRTLFEEQYGRCALCRYEFTSADIEGASYDEEVAAPERETFPGEVALSKYSRNPVLDHVLPQFLGGDGRENWQILCGSCNSGKGEGLSWILRKGLLPPLRPSELFSITPSLRHAVLSSYVSAKQAENLTSNDLSELRIFRREASRLPVFDNLTARSENQILI